MKRPRALTRFDRTSLIPARDRFAAYRRRVIVPSDGFDCISDDLSAALGVLIRAGVSPNAFIEFVS